MTTAIDDIALQEELARAPLSKKVLRRMLTFLAPYKWAIALVLVMELLWVSCALIGPKLVRIGIDDHIVKGDIACLGVIAALYALTSLARWLLALRQIKIGSSRGQRVLNDLRNAVFTHVQELSMKYFDKTKAGRIIARADRDIESLEEIVTWGLVEFSSCILRLTGVTVLMCLSSPRLFLAIVVTMPPLAVASILFHKYGLIEYRRTRESISRITANLAENINGVRVVQAFVREARNALTFRKLNDRYIRNMMGASRVWNSYFPFIDMMFATATGIILLYGARLIVRGELTIGVLPEFMLLLGMFFWPLEGLTWLYNSALSATAAAERIFQLLDTEPEIKDLKGAEPIPEIKGDVEFENVYFSYDVDGKQEWVLKDISFRAEAGQTIALVGPTGGGKSSTVALIPRFYEVQRGCVTIDGYDIKDVTLKSLHEQMGIVLQDSFLFTGTVMKNLKFANPNVSEQQVVEAAKALGAHDCIMKLSDGYQTQVHERGAGLSQGERQLICFTRAFIANPRILILDEATSSVDTMIEQRLQEAMGRLMRDRTSFVVAHRLSTVRYADLVLVVGDGTIREQGTHQELLALGGEYAKLYHEYMRDMG